jgi:hypothetical protein
MGLQGTVKELKQARLHFYGYNCQRQAHTYWFLLE